jgi:tRNA threonylcarbamoyladenosine modification (KEOPS) complex Cgi121 subunit
MIESDRIRLFNWVIFRVSMSNWCINFRGPYYKSMTIVNDDSRVINKLKTSLSDDARVVIYNRHMFIVQATELLALKMGHSIRRLSNSLKQSLLC